MQTCEVRDWRKWVKLCRGSEKSPEEMDLNQQQSLEHGSVTIESAVHASMNPLRKSMGVCSSGDPEIHLKSPWVCKVIKLWHRTFWFDTDRRARQFLSSVNPEVRNVLTLAFKSPLPWRTLRQTNEFFFYFYSILCQKKYIWANLLFIIKIDFEKRVIPEPGRQR